MIQEQKVFVNWHKACKYVIPAKAGIQYFQCFLSLRFHKNDGTQKLSALNP